MSDDRLTADTPKAASSETAASPESNERPRRGVKSYVLRAGRMTAAQTRGLEEVWPRLGLRVADGRQDLEALFGRRAPCVVEIGFGMGASLIEQAERHPETDFIGVEVHAPGVGKLLDEADKRGLTNLRVYREDALEVLSQCLPEASLDGVQLFFPDPWPKKKHHKRRIVQPAFVALVRSRLRPGGWLHMATDWEAYAEHMAEVLSEAPGLRNTAPEGHYVPRPAFRPLTKFETRGEKLGHGVWDLIYERVEG
ncbi:MULTISPECIES: tRNA (guanosine(46)-N7)-methyltransferase TrmB [unclassified Modicisalibacter]|uniref:tRNA (guanosine(46)-N7)-methyltransferase TrmB n=1 Tax=unclassified Modicisalibacter TaxID=2679913 RepID=UPI001CCA98CE|nr:MULTISPECIES: tRNA (guanosine(46)-N7)-methyltransferase TrmB [unclassified Modicisalibacter]MBZ9558835.1 tRNA (guanosine(46)-N7)-methyltransferase TrmB [Modicisalibacter sp. R2A 31.J]MBZ9575273.1 tRNA (guanosine(46)-N7)-methyltransferase TrmB [Modicisalibacter sp. MOD 31.J]